MEEFPPWRCEAVGLIPGQVRPRTVKIIPTGSLCDTQYFGGFDNPVMAVLLLPTTPSGFKGSNVEDKFHILQDSC